MRASAGRDDHGPHVDDGLPAPGMVIGDRYQLEEQIGEGAFSEVYRAVDLVEHKRVALKLLNQGSVDAAGQERFRREAALARKLEHPNIVRLIDFDLEAHPVPFIAYELLEGETLDRVIAREGGFSEVRAARVAMSVLLSLMEAHDAGIVHRDVKPGNVFVCSGYDGPGAIKVLDFGIARSTEPAEAQVTAAGLLIGTPRYMPPEQIRGQKPAPAMDVYATGMMLAEMLVGAPILRCSAVEACLEQLKDERIPLPEVVQRSGLWPVIERATDKNLDRRYGSATDMIADLERVRAGLSPTPLVDTPPPTSEDDADLRPSLVPTSVMQNPENVPSVAPEAASGPAPALVPSLAPSLAPAESTGQGRWVIAAVLLLMLALTVTALGVYVMRTGGLR